MLKLYEYLRIFEAASGPDLNRGKNIAAFKSYLQKYHSDHRCIIPDNDDVRNKYNDLQEWFCNDDNTNDALFYLKSNDSICMYKPNADRFDDAALAKIAIKRRDDGAYNITDDGTPGKCKITAKLEATQKALNSAITDAKIWPDKWDKFIVKGEFELGDKSEMPPTVIDFKSQGAYVLNSGQFNQIQTDLRNQFEKTFGADSVCTRTIGSNDIPGFLKNVYDENSEDRKTVEQMMANVLSEPLAILYVLNNINGICDSICKSVSGSRTGLGQLEQIIIPIRQNWPVADFYIRFSKMPNRLIAVSVKSNGAGNSSTILGCLPIVDSNDVTITDKDKDALKAMFETIIPQLNTTGKAGLKLKNGNDLENVAMYALHTLKQETLKKAGNAQRLINTYNSLLNIIGIDADNGDSANDIDKSLCNTLTKISTLGGTNVIEKILVCLFNTSNAVIEKIKNAVADATSCYKITVCIDGSASCIQQSPNSSKFRLINKQGGQSLIFTANGDVKLGHKTKQGQWIGYSFK